MRILRQIGIITSILLFSEALVRLFSLPVPANVLGMVILFLLLCFRMIKPEDLKETADFLYHHMAFFIIPATCAIVANYRLLSGSLLPFLVITVLSTILVFGSTGWTVQLLQRLRRRKEKHIDE